MLSRLVRVCLGLGPPVEGPFPVASRMCVCLGRLLADVSIRRRGDRGVHEQQQIRVDDERAVRRAIAH